MTTKVCLAKVPIKDGDEDVGGVCGVYGVCGG